MSALWKYVRGVRLAVVGALYAWDFQEIQTSVKKGFVRCVLWTLWVNTGILLCTIPVIFGSKLVSFIIGKEEISLTFWDAFWGSLRFSAWAIPTIGLFVMRMFNTSQSFNLVLSKLDPAFAARLKAAPSPSLCESLSSLSYRVIIQLGILLAVAVLSRVPVIGPYVVPATVFYRLARPYQFQISITNVVFAVVSFLLPPVWGTWVLSLQSASLCLSYELLAPYMAKRKAMRDASNNNKKGDIISRQRPTIMAFAAPWMLVMEGAAAYLLIEIIEKDE
ncbi:hypothetical protein AAMO2058_001720900 [Amorphochlora amoebiformis]